MEERAGCFKLIVLWLSVPLSYGTLDGSEVCDSGISWFIFTYSLYIYI